MFRNTIAAAAIMLTVLGAAACGSDSTGPGNPGSGTIALKNESTAQIVSVQFTLCTDESWGPNRLASGEVIATGAIRQWTAEPGCYDFRVATADKAGYWYDRQLTDGGAINLALSSAANLEAGTAAAVKGR